MLEPLTFRNEEDEIVCQRLIADIFLHKEQRPLGHEFPREGLPQHQMITFGSFERKEGKATVRYQITNDNGYRGVEVRYDIDTNKPLYETCTIDWELKR